MMTLEARLSRSESCRKQHPAFERFVFGADGLCFGQTHTDGTIVFVYPPFVLNAWIQYPPHVLFFCFSSVGSFQLCVLVPSSLVVFMSGLEWILK